jgi:hypothetical protein
VDFIGFVFWYPWLRGLDIFVFRLRVSWYKWPGVKISLFRGLR